MENANSFNLLDFIKFIQTKALFLLGIPLLISAFVFVVSMTIEDYYISNARLTVAEQQSAPSGSNSGFINSLGGSFGISNPSSSKVMEIQELVYSRDFIRRILSKPGVYEKLVYSESYDKENGKLIIDKDYYSSPIDIPEGALIPMDEIFFKGYRAFKKNFEFTMNIDSAFYSFGFKHISPEFSKEILDLVIQGANESQKQINIEEATAALQYLENEIVTASNSEVRGSISKLIEMQLKNKMIAKMRSEILIVTIDAPFIPVSKAGPQRALIAVMSFFIFLFLSIPIFAFLYSKK